MRSRRSRRISAVITAARFDPREDAIDEDAVRRAAKGCPTSRQADEVNEIETGAVGGHMSGRIEKQTRKDP